MKRSEMQIGRSYVFTETLKGGRSAPSMRIRRTGKLVVIGRSTATFDVTFTDWAHGQPMVEHPCRACAIAKQKPCQAHETVERTRSVTVSTAAVQKLLEFKGQGVLA